MSESSSLYQDSHDKKEMENPVGTNQSAQPQEAYMDAGQQVSSQQANTPQYDQAQQNVSPQPQQGYPQDMGNPQYYQSQQSVYTQPQQGYTDNMGAQEVSQQNVSQPMMGNPQYYVNQQPIYGQPQQVYMQSMTNPDLAQQSYYQPQYSQQVNPYNVQPAPQYFPQGYIQPLINPYMSMGAPQEQNLSETQSDSTYSESMASEASDTYTNEPKYDANKYGQVMEIINDMANGTPPEMSKIMDVLYGTDTQFIKGAVVGAASTFLMTNEAVKGAAVSMVAKLMNAFGKTE